MKIKIRIEGTHCVGCKTRIEAKVRDLKGVKHVCVDYVTGDCVVEFDDSKVSQQRITKAIEKLGYKVTDHPDKSVSTSQAMPFAQRLIIGGVLLALFFVGYMVVQKTGALALFSRLNEGNLNYGLIFVIGLLASFHCVGMCGGLVIAYTVGSGTSEGKQPSLLQPHLWYNLGRVVSYTTIGAALGGFGSFFSIRPVFAGTLTVIVGTLMVLLGLSLLTNWSWLGRLNWAPLSSLARFFYAQSDGQKGKGPFAIGLLNGFMPCGPLQAMQLYALASGSVARGALSMALYALGTIPALLGFGAVSSFINQARVKQVLKVSGTVVLILGLLMISRGLGNFGLEPGNRAIQSMSGQAGSIATPTVVASQASSTREPTAEPYQMAKMQLTYKGYLPNTLRVKKGILVRWVIEVKEMSRCTDEIILPEYNIRKRLHYGENVIEFVPTREGVIWFSCWMQMVWGKFVVS